MPGMLTLKDAQIPMREPQWSTRSYRQWQHLDSTPPALVIRSSLTRRWNLVSPVGYRIVGLEVLTDVCDCLDTHSVGHECLLERVDPSHSSGGDDDGAEKPATPPTLEGAVQVAIGDLTVTDTVNESPTQSSRTVEHDEQYQKPVDSWEALARALSDSSDEDPFAGHHELSMNNSSEEETPGEELSAEGVVDTESDQSEGGQYLMITPNRKVVRDFKSQGSYISPGQSTLDHARSEVFSESFREDDEQSFSNYDEQSFSDCSSYNISDGFPHPDVYAAHFGYCDDHDEESAGLQGSGDQLRAHRVAYTTLNRPSSRGFHITSHPRSASFPPFPHTSFPHTSFPVYASEEELGETLICDPPLRRCHSDSEVNYV
jgi:hypothetical protein